VNQVRSGSRRDGRDRWGHDRWFAIFGHGLLVAGALLAGTGAQAQSVSQIDQTEAKSAPDGGSAPFPDAAPFCVDLRKIIALTATRDKFASIAGPPREGNFRDVKLALPGWNDCALYGARTYTCDSQEFKTASEVEAAQSQAGQQIKACLGDTWAEIKDRSSSGYAVLHPSRGNASITLSIDKKSSEQYVVRLVVFLR